MNYEIQSIELKKEHEFEFLVLTTKSQDVYEDPRRIVVFNECTIDYYKMCIKKYGSFEKLPVQWRILTNVVIVSVQLKKPILIKNNAFGTEYETSVVPVLCRYTVDDELVASGDFKNAVRWAPGWSPAERAHYYDNKTTFYICEDVVK